MYNLVVFVFVFISVFCLCVWRQLPEELGLTVPLYLGHIVVLFCLGFVFYVVFHIVFCFGFVFFIFNLYIWGISHSVLVLIFFISCWQGLSKGGTLYFVFVLYLSLTETFYVKHIPFCLGVVFCKLCFISRWQGLSKGGILYFVLVLYFVFCAVLLFDRTNLWEAYCILSWSFFFVKGWLAIAKLKPLSLFISPFYHYQDLS